MLQKILSAAGIIGNTWTLGRCPNWWGGFDPRVAAAGKNRLRWDTNKYRPHQGAAECERRRLRRWVGVKWPDWVKKLPDSAPLDRDDLAGIMGVPAATVSPSMVLGGTFPPPDQTRKRGGYGVGVWSLGALRQVYPDLRPQQ